MKLAYRMLFPLLLVLLVPISFAVQAAVGGLIVKCNIEGPRMLLDGKDKGNCPGRILTTPGLHTLEISKPIDADTEFVFHAQVNLPEGEPVKVDAALKRDMSAEGRRRTEEARRSPTQQKMLERMKMMDKMEIMDRMELADRIDEARACAARYDFTCSDARLAAATQLATKAADRDKITEARSYHTAQQAKQAEEQRIAAIRAKLKADKKRIADLWRSWN